MVRPTYFGFNDEAAISNTHQQRLSAPAATVAARACAEWQALAELLAASGVTVLAVDDEPAPHAPDAVFPNNWFSTHRDGTLVLYPMAVASRRPERRPGLIERLQRELRIRRVVDLTACEAAGQYLEGTGSLVLERRGRVAYAARSVRTHDSVLRRFSAELGYRAVVFETTPRGGHPEYHTNVVMAVGESAAVICLDAIREASAQEQVAAELRASGHRIIPISVEQMDAFAGNLLQLRSADGSLLWVMSSRAFAAFDENQLRQLGEDARLVHAPLPTIEEVGGGSARCMLAELFFAAPPATASGVVYRPAF